jgi:hypothetical protein
MENIAIESWLVIMGMSGLGLVLAIGVAKVLRRVFRPKRKSKQDPVRTNPQQLHFEDEVRVRVFKQQADRAFQSISAVIDEEYRTLLAMIEKGEIPDPSQVQIRVSRPFTDEWAPTVSNLRQKNDGKRLNPYAEIGKYIHQGLSIAQIADVLQIPHNEVELAVKLRSAKHAAA